MAPTRTTKPDALCAAAVDLAHAAAVETAGAIGVGEHLGVPAEGDRVVSHSFACPRPRGGPDPGWGALRERLGLRADDRAGRPRRRDVTGE